MCVFLKFLLISCQNVWLTVVELDLFGFMLRNLTSEVKYFYFSARLIKICIEKFDVENKNLSKFS